MVDLKVFVYIYWEDSNVFINAKVVAVEREGEDANFRVRINLPKLLKLVRAGQVVRRVIAESSVLPELRRLWRKMEEEGVDVHRRKVN